MIPRKRANPRKARCWLTGVELKLDEAMLVDLDVATTARRELAQRLAMLDRLLAEASGRVGNDARGGVLGLRSRDRRTVSKAVAAMYDGIIQVPNLFVTMTEWHRRGWKRWVDGVKGDPRVRHLFAGLNDEAWRRLSTLATQVRNLTDAHVPEMLHSRADALVAREALRRGLSPDALERWLADVAPARVLEVCEVPPERRAGVLPALQWRQAVQRARLVLKADVDEATRSRDAGDDTEV